MNLATIVMSITMFMDCAGLIQSFAPRLLATHGLRTKHHSSPGHTLHRYSSLDNSRCCWYTCSSTNELVEAIASLLQPDDVVVEIGAQLRAVSATILDTVKPGVLFMDIQRNKFPSSAASNTMNSNTTTTRTKAMRVPGGGSIVRKKDTFVELRALDDWRPTLLSHVGNKNFTVLVLDINSIVGNDLEWTSFTILKEFSSLFPTCRAVLVKSKLLNQWAHRIVHGEHWIQGLVSGTKRRRLEDGSVHSPKIIATVGVKQYRRTIAQTVQPGDAVLEVGCHFGTTTRLLQEAAAATDNSGGYAMGVDVGPRIIRNAQQRNPEFLFAVGDAWRTAHLLRLQRHLVVEPKVAARTATKIGFDVVYVDIGGLSGTDGLMEALVLLNSLQNALEPRSIVIKSSCMQQLSTMLVPFYTDAQKRRSEERSEERTAQKAAVPST